MRALVVSTFLLIVAGCTSAPTPTTPNDSADAIPTSVTTAPSATSSTLATTGPTEPTCPEPAAIPGSAAVIGVPGDVDGDGRADVISTYTAPVPRLRVDLAAGGSIDVAMEAEESPAGFVPIGAADIDDDGDGEVFATVGAGAYTVLVGVWVLDGCDLVRATVGGGPGIFPVGASVSNAAGLSCEGVGDLDVLFAESLDGVEFESGFSPYRLEGTELVQGFGDGGTVDADGAYETARLVCGDLTYP